MEDFYWCSSNGELGTIELRTIEQVVAAYAAKERQREKLASNLLDAVLKEGKGEGAAFQVLEKTPIDGRDLLAIIKVAYRAGAHSGSAKKLAALRHAENYALASDAVKYWKEHIDPGMSASKAANELVRVVPLSHKKLSELVSAERKKRF